MALASVGTVVTATAKSTSSTLVSGATAAVSAGNIVVVVAAVDNVSTTSGNTNEITSITDSVGNTYTKVYEYCHSPGGSLRDGAVVALFYSVITNALTTSSTITTNYSTGSTATAKATTAWNFSKGAGTTIGTVPATPLTEGVTGGDPGALQISGQTSREYLFLRAIAGETNTSTGFTVTSNYTTLTNANTTGGAANGNIRSIGEFRVLTGTGDTSNPAFADAFDQASVFAALYEVGGGDVTPVPSVALCSAGF